MSENPAGFPGGYGSYNPQQPVVNAMDKRLADVETIIQQYGPLLSTLGQIGKELATSFGLGSGPGGAAAGLLALLGQLAQTQHGVSMAHIEPPAPYQPEDGSTG